MKTITSALCDRCDKAIDVGSGVIADYIYLIGNDGKPSTAIVNPSSGTSALHIACLIKMIKILMEQGVQSVRLPYTTHGIVDPYKLSGTFYTNE